MRRSTQPLHSLAVCFAFLVAGLLMHTKVVLAQPTTYPLVQQSNLTYEGAFRVPSGKFGGSSFDYGGTALAYNPTNDSLFLVGHDWHQQVAEISIPQIIHSAQLSNLVTTSVLQPFTDATNGAIKQAGAGTIKLGGHLVYQGRLY